MKDINNFNSKGELNGYQEWYYIYGLSCRANYKNHKPIGYVEFAYGKRTIYYIR